MKKLKLITKILAIITLALVAFIGIYIQKNGKMTNIIKDYELSKDLKGYRQVVFEVSDALEVLDSKGNVVGNTDDYDDDTISSKSYKKGKEKVNKQENLNEKTFEKSKKIIQKRLDNLGVEDYLISSNNENGTIYLQLPENEDTDTVISYIDSNGKFEIKDSKNYSILISNDNLKSVNTAYNKTEDGTAIYLSFQLNKEGTEILKDLSSTIYAKNAALNQSGDNNNQEQKEITVSINGKDVTTTSFPTPIEDGKIELRIGNESTDSKDIKDNVKSASFTKAILNSGKLSLLYKLKDSVYVKTDISDITIRNVIIISGVLALILLIVLIIKYKFKGLLVSIDLISFLSIFLLLIRYTNVLISISGAMAIVFTFLLNYLIKIKLLKSNISNLKEFKYEISKIVMKIIPILIISILFVFMKWTTLSSFGMVTFWGLVLLLIDNLLVTKGIIE